MNQQTGSIRANPISPFELNEKLLQGHSFGWDTRPRFTGFMCMYPSFSFFPDSKHGSRGIVFPRIAAGFCLKDQCDSSIAKHVASRPVEPLRASHWVVRQL